VLKVLAPPPLPVWLFAVCFLICFVVFLIDVLWLFCFVVNVSVVSLLPPPHVSLFPSCVVAAVSLFVFIVSLLPPPHVSLFPSCVVAAVSLFVFTAFFFFWISSFLDLVCGGRFM
jgi:hypothetical protein